MIMILIMDLGIIPGEKLSPSPELTNLALPKSLPSHATKHRGKNVPSFYPTITSR